MKRRYRAGFFISFSFFIFYCYFFLFTVNTNLLFTENTVLISLTTFLFSSIFGQKSKFDGNYFFRSFSIIENFNLLMIGKFPHSILLCPPKSFVAFHKKQFFYFSEFWKKKFNRCAMVLTARIHYESTDGLIKIMEIW